MIRQEKKRKRQQGGANGEVCKDVAFCSSRPLCVKGIAESLEIQIKAAEQFETGAAVWINQNGFLFWILAAKQPQRLCYAPISCALCQQIWKFRATWKFSKQTFHIMAAGRAPLLARCGINIGQSGGSLGFQQRLFVARGMSLTWTSASSRERANSGCGRWLVRAWFHFFSSLHHISALSSSFLLLMFSFFLFFPLPFF